MYDCLSENVIYNYDVPYCQKKKTKTKSKEMKFLKNIEVAWIRNLYFHGIFIFIDEYYAQLYYVINDCYYTVVKYEMCHYSFTEI